MTAGPVAAATPDPRTDPAGYLEAVEATARRVDTPCGDGTMAWRIWGEGDPVVFAHGAQGAWSHWLRNIDALSAHCTMIVADMPGHGDSALPASEDHAGITAAMAQGVRAIIGEGRQADFVGFSFGGCMSAYVAAAYPDMVRRLILVGTGGLDTPLGDVRLQRVGGLEGEARKAAIRANLLGLMLHEDDTIDDLTMHLHMVNARKFRLYGAADLVIPDKLARILPAVQAPVDAIWGEFDRPHPNPPCQEAVLRRSHPDADFRVIADAGHWAAYERPEAFDAALLDLLAQPVRERRGANSEI